ncbi:MAG: DEAD/DEAH box helicase [Planctomycetota bacterium]|jgi:ATP-dependent RNA helicase DeaD
MSNTPDAPTNPKVDPSADAPVDPQVDPRDRDDIFDREQTFAQLGLAEPLARAVREMEFIHPTRIQAQLIPVALKGGDVLGQAKTGTGKTAAFGLPLIHRLVGVEDAFAALVLVPTRELAIQVTREIREFAKHTSLQTVAIYGGQPIRAQATKLEKRPSIVVGTPGRVMDMNGRGLLPYDNIRIAVLDEVDRMLDIGFRDDIRRILGALKKKPQTIFVSATISPEIEKLARSYMKNPDKIVTKAASLHLIRKEEPGLTVVFCRTKRSVDTVAKYLSDKGIDAHPIHGDMFQTKRNRVMEKLRSGKLGVLVASDLASRGLDVDDITHVVNYDLPDDPEVYIHRIGRTARAGRSGVAWSFVCPDQGELLTSIEMLANIEIPRLEYPDFEPGTVPADVRAQRELDEQRRAQRAVSQNRHAVAVPVPTGAAADPSRYPGGIVPIQAPQKRLGGRTRTRRR